MLYVCYMSSAFSSPDFPVVYRPDLHVVVGRWMREIQRAQEVQQNYASLLEEAEQHQQCRFWLLDARRRFRTAVEITDWVEDYFPRMAEERLGGEIRIAYLLAPRQLLVSTESPPFPQLRHPVHGHLLSRQFTDEGKAIAWLLREQRQPPV